MLVTMNPPKSPESGSLVEYHGASSAVGLVYGASSIAAAHSAGVPQQPHALISTPYGRNPLAAYTLDRHELVSSMPPRHSQD